MCVINSLRMTAPSKKRSQPVRKTWGSPIGSFAAKSIPVLFEAADLGSSFNKANTLVLQFCVLWRSRATAQRGYCFPTKRNLRDAV